MTNYAELQADALSIRGFANENGLIPTRYGGDKKSWQYLVDQFETEFAEQLLEINKSRGYRVVGTFAAGFEYELFNDVGIDASGNSWIYVGNGAPVATVAPGTDPSLSADYQQATFNSIDGVVGLRDELKLREKNSSFAEAISEDAEVGTNYKIEGVNWIVVESSDAGGYYITGLASGRKLKLNQKYILASSLDMSESADNTEALQQLLLSEVVVFDVSGNYNAGSVSVTNNKLKIIGGEGVTFTFNGPSDSEFFVSIQTDDQNAYIDLGALTFDGVSNAAKIVQVRNTTKGKRLTANISTINALQTETTGLAAGLYVDGGFEVVISNNFKSENIGSIKSTGAVSSGARVEQNGNSVSDLVIFNEPKVSNVYPSSDGDGLVVTQTYPYTGSERTIAIINDGRFHNCDKRAIKTQVHEAHDNNTVVTRDRDTPVTAGKIEIDHQYGNASTNNPIIKYNAGSNAPTALFSMNPQRGEVNGMGSHVSGGSCVILDTTAPVENIVLGSSFSATDKITNSSISEFKFFGKVNTPIALRPLASSTFNDSVINRLSVEMYVQEVVNSSLISLDRSGTGWAYLDNLTVKDTVIGNKRIDLVETITTNVGLQSGGYLISGGLNIKDPNGEYEVNFEESGTVNSSQSFSINAGLNSSISYELMYSTNAGTNEMMARAGTLCLGASTSQVLEITSIDRDAASGGGTLSLSTSLSGSIWTITFSKSAGVATSSGNLSLTAKSANGLFYT